MWFAVRYELMNSQGLTEPFWKCRLYMLCECCLIHSPCPECRDGYKFRLVRLGFLQVAAPLLRLHNWQMPLTLDVCHLLGKGDCFGSSTSPPRTHGPDFSNIIAGTDAPYRRQGSRPAGRQFCRYRLGVTGMFRVACTLQDLHLLPPIFDLASCSAWNAFIICG